MLLTAPAPIVSLDGFVSTTILDEGSAEMERLLGLLPASDSNVEELNLQSLATAEPAVGDEWSWLANEGVF